MSIVVEHLTKRFGTPGKEPASQLAPVLEDVSLQVGANEVVTVIGPSGSGKSTLLNCIAGLEPYEGSIEVDGTPVRSPHPAVAVVFQSPHLLPWRTTLGNVEYGLEVGRRMAKGERRQAAEAAIEVVGLTGSSSLYPRQLSGGMQQRVNIARALAVQPEVLLMDEPFGALDAITKERLQEQLQGIVADRKLSVLFITHDISEAIYLGDRVVTLSARPGRISLTKVIDEPRPRSLSLKQSAGFQALYGELWKSLA